MGLPGHAGQNGVPGIPGAAGPSGLPGRDGCNGTDVSFHLPKLLSGEARVIINYFFTGLSRTSWITRRARTTRITRYSWKQG